MKGIAATMTTKTRPRAQLILSRLAVPLLLLLLVFGLGRQTVLPQRLNFAQGPSANILSLRAQTCLDDCEGWLLEYASWHAEQLNLLRSGYDIPLLVYTCTGGCGGVGDRLSGMLSVFYAAVATKRLFLIDHTVPFALNETLVPSLIDWDHAYLINSSFSSSSVYLIDALSMIAFDKLMEAALQNTSVVTVIMNRYYVGMALWTPSIIGSPNTTSSQYIGSIYRMRQKSCRQASKRYFGTLTTSQTINLAFSHLFDFSTAVRRRSDEMMLESGLTSSAYVAIHARLGGSSPPPSKSVVGWTDPERHSLSDIDSFLTCARSKMNRADSPNNLYHEDRERTALVFSDSVAFKEEAHRLDRQFTSPSTTTLFHVDRSESPDPETLRVGNIDTYAELLLLSEASCIVGSQSTFSGIAASISTFGREEGRCFSMFHDCDRENFDFFEETERGALKY